MEGGGGGEGEDDGSSLAVNDFVSDLLPLGPRVDCHM